MEACKKLRGDKNTFVIRLGRAENGAWQGSLVWIDEGREQSFDSMQEMLQLMDSTIDGAPAYPRLVR